MTATIEAIRAGDLYALLSVCTDEDLAPLVEVITGKLSNYLEINEDYKKHHPRHSKYHKAIGDELRLYGGNSLRNIFRGEGPPYDEIVVDVCKKLDVPCQPGRTVENESRLLTLYLERQWKALSQEEQEEIIARAREEAGGQVWTSTTILKEGLTFVGARLLFGPLGWGSLVFSVAEPAFKVTVPCVLHIAFLRRRILEDAARPQPDRPRARAEKLLSYSFAGISNAASGLAQRLSGLLPAVAEARPPSLVIGPSEDKPVLSLTPISKAPAEGWYPVDDSGSGISRLNPVLQAVPNLAVAHNVATTRYMEVVINGQLIPAADGNGLRAIAKGVDGKFVENARLFEPTQLSNVVNAAVLFQVVSVAVAQKHLADISRKLSDIKAGIDRIQRFQANQRRAVLTGATRYFEQVAPSILAGELSEPVRHEIERHETGLLQVQDHLMEDIRQESRDILNLKDTDTFGSKGMQDAIRKHQELLEDLYQQLLLCIRARACGWQLLLVYPGGDRLKEDRKRSIQESLGFLNESGDLLRQTDQFMRQKVKSLSAFWNTAATLNERKLSLLEWNDALTADVAACKEQIAQDLRAAEAVIADARQPVTMVLRIEDDRIVAACTA